MSVIIPKKLRFPVRKSGCGEQYAARSETQEENERRYSIGAPDSKSSS